MKRIAKINVKVYNKSITPIISEVKIMSENNKTIHPLMKMRAIMQEEMKKSTKSEKEIRKSIGIKRYEK